MRIVFTGGGTGGHLYPIIAVAREIKRIAEEERILDLQLFYFSPEAVPPQSVEEEEIVFRHITAGKLRRYVSFQNVTDIFKIVFGIFQAIWSMFLVMPDVVFAKGGYGSFPTLLAARIYRIPVLIHESDAVPGRVSQWAGRWVARAAISFQETGRYFPAVSRAFTGIPIRKRILWGNVDQAREILGIFSPRPVILIMGGSQGARVINETVTQILKDLVGQYEVIHQAGEKNFEDVRLETMSILGREGATYYHLAGFFNESELDSAYLLSDLIISRAGATSIFEIAARGKPAIVIPIENSAQDHQRKNAYAYAGHGAAVVIEEGNLTPSVLFNEIQKLMADPERRKKLSEAAQRFSRVDAAEILAKEILKLGLH